MFRYSASHPHQLCFLSSLRANAPTTSEAIRDIPQAAASNISLVYGVKILLEPVCGVNGRFGTFGVVVGVVGVGVVVVGVVGVGVVVV